MASKKPVTKKEVKPPKHPLMLDGKDWDRMKVMEFICTRLATSSNGVGRILLAGYEGLKLPDYSTIMQWMTEDSKLADMYARAKEDQSDFMADELMEIADEAAADNVAVNRARLRVDTRKWLAAKLKPRKYGDKLQVAGDKESPLQHQHSGSVELNITAEEAYKRMLDGD